MKKLLQYKNTALILFLIWTLVGLAFSGATFIAITSENRTESVWAIFSSSMIRVYVWGALSPLVYFFARRFVIDPRQLKFGVVAYNILFGLFLSLLYTWIFVGVAWLTTPNYFAFFPTWWNFISRQIIMLSWYTIISLYIPTFLSVQALLLYRNYKDEEAKNARLQAEVSSARLSALKMQLQPHFLFNSLHAISSLILVNPALANKMVALLGDFLRQTLEHSNEQIVTLEEELVFLRCYLEIEKTRFEDRLSVLFDIDEKALEARVPHLIMQPIVENAVKHGIAPYAVPGQIAISAKKRGEELFLQVKDSGLNSNEKIETDINTKNGFGIANVGLRLEHIYGDRARLTISKVPPSGCQVDLILPFKINDRWKENES